MGDHLRRLSRSARFLGMDISPAEKRITLWLKRCLEAAGISPAVLRVMVTWEEASGISVVLFVRPFIAYPGVFYRRGVRVGTAVNRRPGAGAFPGQVKSNQYLGHILALVDGMERYAHRRGGFFEILLRDQRGHLSEGTVSNVFIVREGEIWTPPVSCGILMGTTRQWALDEARRMGVRCHEAPLTRYDLYNAEEVFLTNTTMEVMPVAFCDGRKIGRASPGPLSRELRSQFLSTAIPRL